MSVTVGWQESGRGRRGEKMEGEDKEAMDDGERHIYRFPGGREKQRQSLILNKFIGPELRYTWNELDPTDSKRPVSSAKPEDIWVRAPALEWQFQWSNTSSGGLEKGVEKGRTPCSRRENDQFRYNGDERIARGSNPSLETASPCEDDRGGRRSSSNVY